MSSGIRFLLAALAVILLLVFIIVLIVRGGSGPSTIGVPGVDLTDLANNRDSAVQYIVEGPINASEEHRTVRITVSPTIRQLDVLRGYEGEIMTRQTYDNNTNAYSEFMAALERADFTSENVLGDDVSAEAVCPIGNRVHYQVLENNEETMDLWSASCTDGTFAGDTSLTRRLFQTQIPDYSQLTRNVNVTGSVSRNTGLVL